MDTLKAIISKANSFRFADKSEGLAALPTFDNTLSFEAWWSNKPTKLFDQIFFKDDVVLLQVKSGLTATVVVTKYPDGGASSVKSSSFVTTYSAFKIYEYVFTLSSLERFYLEVETEESLHRSECIKITTSNKRLLLVNWSIQDLLNDSFEFDYTTSLSITYTNYMRLKAQLLDYKASGQSKVYDNQNEMTKLKGSVFRNEVFKTGSIPRQMAEILVIASQHDLFTVNLVGYVAEGLPEITMLGGGAQLTANLTDRVSKGMNTDDIGYNIELMTLTIRDFTADTTVIVPAGYFIHFFSFDHEDGSAGSYTVKAGYSAGADDLFSAFGNVVAAPPLSELHIAGVHKQKSFDTPTTIFITYVGGTGTGKFGVQISKNALS